jgi:hypothetical protein
MSSTWRTVASAQALAASSGSSAATRASSIELAFSHQRGAHQPDHRLGGREHQVRRLWLHAVEIALLDDAALVQHEHGVGVRGGEHLRPGHWRVGGADLQGVERAARLGQRPHQAARRQRPRGEQLARVLERPDLLRPALPVANVDAVFRRRRETLHQPRGFERRRSRWGLGDGGQGGQRQRGAGDDRKQLAHFAAQ